MLHFADLTLDPDTYRALRQGKVLHVTTFQFALLKFLVEHPHQVFSLGELGRSAWTPEGANKVAVRRSMVRLRQALTEYGGTNLIRTVRGVGYALDTDCR
jgi:two-component system phosphate regulon response regulator PhoB